MKIPFGEGDVSCPQCARTDGWHHAVVIHRDDDAPPERILTRVQCQCGIEVVLEIDAVRLTAELLEAEPPQI